MSDAVAPAPVKETVKAKKPKTTPSHPPVAEMVNAAISALKERKGSSLIAIKKYVAATYKVDMDRLAPFIRRYLKSAVTAGKLVQTKGTGATGSFKLGKEDKPKKEKKAKKPKSKKTEKPKKAKTPTKKTTKPKTKKAKTPKKTAKPKSKTPKKTAKKPAAKKAKTPKKAAAKPKKAAAKPKAKKPAKK